MNVENILGVYQMTNSTTFPGEVNIPSNSTFKIGDSVPAFLAGVTSVSVSEGNAGTNCSVAVGGNATAKSLTFTIPKGANGPNGNQGNSGNQGPAGQNGPPGNGGPPGNRGPQGNGGPTGPSPYATNNKLETNYYIRSNGYAYIDNAQTAQTFWARVYGGGQGSYNHYSLTGGQRGYATNHMGGGAVYAGRYYYGDDTYSTQYNAYQFNPAISMYGAYYTRCAGLNARSDERFKEDIKTLDTEKALKKIHNIRPVSYYNKADSAFELGFIAQEVEKELPQSIIDTVDSVSNINGVGSFSNKREAFTSEAEKGDGELNVKCSKYTFTLRDKTWPTELELSDLALLEFKTVGENGEEQKIGGEYRRDVCGEPHNQRGFGQIDVLIDDVGEGCELPDGIKQHPEVYLLNGTIEYDSKVLNYDQVFTTLTAAVQELDKQLQLDLEWIERLESKLN